MDRFSTIAADGHPLSQAEYIAVHLLDPSNASPRLAAAITQARRLKVATEILCGFGRGSDPAYVMPDERVLKGRAKFALMQADTLIGVVYSTEADIRQRAFRQAAELIRANGIIFGEDGPRLQPRPEGDRSGLTYADELERLAALEIKE